MTVRSASAAARRTKSRAGWLGVVACLSGCSAGLHSDAQPAQVYYLRAMAEPAGTPRSASSGDSVRVGRPTAAPGLDTEHIVLVQTDHRMSYYVGSRWAADLPHVVEAMAVQTLRASGAWTSVQDSSSAFPADEILQIVIRRFEADYSGGSAAPEVHVVLDCILGRSAGRQVLASFVASGSAVAAANRLADVVGAFEEAANKALGDIAVQAARPATAAMVPERTGASIRDTPAPER